MPLAWDRLVMKYDVSSNHEWGVKIIIHLLLKCKLLQYPLSVGNKAVVSIQGIVEISGPDPASTFTMRELEDNHFYAAVPENTGKICFCYIFLNVYISESENK